MLDIFSIFTFIESAIFIDIRLYLFFIADIQYVKIVLMNKICSEGSKVEVCALLDFNHGICSNNINFTVDLLVSQNPGL